MKIHPHYQDEFLDRVIWKLCSLTDFWVSSIAKATLWVERKQTCDHPMETYIKTIKYWNSPQGGWMGPHISPWILSKKVEDFKTTLVKDSLIIILPCE